MFIYQIEILIKYQTYPFPLKCLPSTKSPSLIFCNKLKLMGGLLFPHVQLLSSTLTLWGLKLWPKIVFYSNKQTNETFLPQTKLV